MAAATSGDGGGVASAVGGRAGGAGGGGVGGCGVGRRRWGRRRRDDWQPGDADPGRSVADVLFGGGSGLAGEEEVLWRRVSALSAS